MPTVAETFVKEMRAHPWLKQFADGVEKDLRAIDLAADGSVETLAKLEEILTIAARRELLLEDRLIAMSKVVKSAAAR